LEGVAGIAGGAEVPAGEGVAGTALVAELADCAGAAGGAGVAAVAGAGVDGVFGVDEDAAGAALGYHNMSELLSLIATLDINHTFETMQTMKPFSSILYDSTVLLSCRILPKWIVSQTCAQHPTS
jgi:hypothetical protein